MENPNIIALRDIFSSRLDTLSHLLDMAEGHFGDEIEGQLKSRITPDMLPLGTQVAFTCNQARHFALWCSGQAVSDLESDIVSMAQARNCISSTKALLASIDARDAKLTELKRIEVGGGAYLELPGASYVSDFLMPNFYFHLTTAYNILRMTGVEIGKQNFMMYLLPFVKQDNG